VLESSELHVEGSRGLSMLVLSPVGAQSARAVTQLVQQQA
jgi:hypothetical protein